jgi:hypothetical protein
MAPASAAAPSGPSSAATTSSSTAIRLSQTPHRLVARVSRLEIRNGDDWAYSDSAAWLGAASSLFDQR